jgi:hypothetical protein
VSESITNADIMTEVASLRARISQVENYETETMNRIDTLMMLVGALHGKDQSGVGTMPQPNTYDEWKNFGKLWLEGGTVLQWFDTSTNADHEWLDIEKDDCWYPYDENLVIRIKPVQGDEWV